MYTVGFKIKNEVRRLDQALLLQTTKLNLLFKSKTAVRARN